MEPARQQQQPEVTTTEVPAQPAPDLIEQLLSKTRPRQTVDGLLAVWDTQAPPLLCSFDDSTDEGRALASRCNGKTDYEMQDLVNSELRVVNFAAMDVCLPNMATGELQDMIRWVLILEDGKTVSTCSVPFADGFSYSARKVGKGPWDPPLRFWVKAQPSRQGRRYFECTELQRGGTLATDAQPNVKKKK